MDELYLIQPSIEHRSQYEAMMDEWELFGGRLNPGALSRYSHRWKRNVDYDEWLKWVEDDRKSTQNLYFLMAGNYLVGAISVRYQCMGIDGHSGFGIRPSERNKGYATRMLSMALPFFKEYGINPVMLSCDKTNIGSAKTITNNGGIFVKEVTDKTSGNIVQVYNLYLDD